MTGGSGAGVYQWQAGRRRLAAHELAVSVTDAMSGARFEHFTARLMRASGFHRARVVGGSGDMGADVIPAENAASRPRASGSRAAPGRTWLAEGSLAPQV